jgi:hypothetical protein
MSRPKGSKNVNTLIQQNLPIPGKNPNVDTRTDDDILNNIIERFETYHRMVIGASEGAITATIVSGAAGIGKSYTAEWALEHARETKGTSFKIIRGAINALDLYEQAYRYRNPRQVIVLDDADRIFDDEDGLNLLKCLLDTSVERKVNWMTDHPRFKGEDALPKEFTYAGAMLFLTNKNFQDYIDSAYGRYVEHMSALMSRSIYLDLKMHSRREVEIWGSHLVGRNKILQQDGCTPGMERDAIDWVKKNMYDLRELSIRTYLKLGKFMKMNDQNWERLATITLLRGV